MCGGCELALMSFCVIFNFLILIFGCHRRTPPGQIASTVIHVLTSIRDADNARWSASLDTPLGLSSIHILPIVLWGWGAISQVERWRFVWSPKHWAASRQRTLHRHPSPGICWLLPFARWLNVMRGVNEWSCLAGEFPNCEYHYAHLQHEVWGAGKWGSLGVDPRALLFEFVSGIVFFSWNQKKKLSDWVLSWSAFGGIDVRLDPNSEFNPPAYCNSGIPIGHLVWIFFVVSYPKWDSNVPFLMINKTEKDQAVFYNHLELDVQVRKMWAPFLPFLMSLPFPWLKLLGCCCCV